MTFRSVFLLVFLVVVCAPAVSLASADEVETMWTNFDNDGVEFKARLLLPKEVKPHAVVVFVHGSEEFAATKYYRFAYGFARRGIASLTFDKRGTGGSGGMATPDFGVLSNDVAAAVDYVSRDERVSGLPRGLVGVSQGGWVAPLVAAGRDDIDFMIIDSGSALSPQENDRWVTEQWLRSAGATESDVADAQPLINAAYQTLRCYFRCSWKEMESVRREAVGSDWCPMLRKAPTNVGFIVNSDQDQLLEMLESMGITGDNDDFTLDPLALLAESDVPVLWLLGEDDDMLPAKRSARLTMDLAASRTATLDVVTYPDQGHSLISRLAMAGEWDELKPVLDFVQAQSE